MAVFGADQIEETKMASRYFEKYYVAVNIGATIATLSISLAQSDSADQTNSIDYFYGYLIAIIMLIGAALLFIVGYRYYIHIPPSETIILKYIPIIINAFQTRHRTQQDSSLRNSSIQEGMININEQSLSFLDYANLVNNGKYNDRIINDAKSFQKALIVFLLLIPYWIIYYQV